MSEEVINVVLFNNGSRSLYITGSRGTDWIAGSESKQVDYYQTKLVGSMRWTGSNWGWLYVGYAPDKPAFQIYIAASSVRVYDYCVQWYDGGNNESGDTNPQTKVDLQGSPSGPGVLVQMLLDFDPWMARLANARPDLTVLG